MTGLIKQLRSSRLARRLGLYIILLSSLITVLTSAVQLYFEYRDDVEIIDNTLYQIEKTQVDNIATRMWELDNEELQRTVNNILGLPAISYVAVYDYEQLFFEAGRKQQKQVVEQSFPLIHTEPQKNEQIGLLVVQASLQNVYQHLLHRAAVILLGNGIKTFIVAAFILLLFHRLVTRHLIHLAKFAESIELHDLDKHFSYDRPQKPPEKADELDILQQAFQTMQTRLGKASRALQDREQRLAVTLQSIGDGVIITDTEGKVVSMNRVAEKLTGWLSEQAAGQHLKTVFHIIDARSGKEAESPVEKVLRTGEIIYLSNHTKLIARDGCSYHIADSAAPIRDNGQIHGVVLVFNDVSEQYRLRESARESRHNLQAILDNSPSIIYSKGTDGHYLFANRSLQQLLGKNEHTIRGLSDYDLFPEEIANQLMAADKEVLMLEKTVTAEHLLPHEDGLHHYHFTHFPVFAERGQIKAVCAIGEDIQEKKKSELLIQQVAEAVSTETGEDFFHSLTLNLCTILGFDFCYVAIRDRMDKDYVKTLSITADGKIADNIRYPLDKTPCRKVLNQKAPYQTQVYLSGIQKSFPENQVLQTMQVQSYIGEPLLNKQGQAIGLLSLMSRRPVDHFPLARLQQIKSILKIFATRVTVELDRIAAEKNLRMVANSLAEAQKMARMGNWVYDFRDASLWWSDEYYHILELGDGHIKPDFSTVLQRIHPQDREAVAELYHNLQAGKAVFMHKYRLLLGDERVKYVCERCQIFYNEQGEPFRATGIMQDISEQKVLEESLNQSQKMDALGKLTGGIAHDFNNMLGVIMGYAELLSASLQSQSEKQKYAREIFLASERGAKLTQKLLAFSRKKNTREQCVDINRQIREEKDMLRKTLTARVRLVLDLQDGLWPVYIDEGDFDNAIVNMCINAMHAVDSRGVVTIKTRNRDFSEEQAKKYSLAAGEYVELSLADNGKGMDEQVRQKIFEPFFSTKGEKGTGLGLSQVYGFMERSGGSIYVESEPGQGTTFYLYFPRYQEKQNAA